MEDIYKSEIKDAPDVCMNCFSVIRVPRERTTSRDSQSDTSIALSSLKLDPDQAGYHYYHSHSSSSSGSVFCNCGAESHHTRIWEARDGHGEPWYEPQPIGFERFKELAKSVVRAAHWKGIEVDASTFTRVAIRERYTPIFEYTAGIRQAARFEGVDLSRDELTRLAIRSGVSASIDDAFSSALAAAHQAALSPTGIELQADTEHAEYAVA